MGFSSYCRDEKFQELPLMFYFAKTKALDLTKSCVNIIPAGLKGVDEVRLRDIPFAVAPDFMGKIVYRGRAGYQSPVSEEDLQKAKETYQKNKEFCETPHTWAGNALHNYCNLPANMHFVTIGKQVFLDLRQSQVKLSRSNMLIGGIKAVLLPSDDNTKAVRLMRRIQDEKHQNQKS